MSPAQTDMAASRSDSVAAVSVVIPIHNGATHLGETLASLWAQDFEDFEVLVVDDASTDQLRDVLVEHANRRLTVIHLEKNVGVSAARNVGIMQCRGALIAFCDSDDVCLPGRLAFQTAFLAAHPSIDVCGSAYTIFGAGDERVVEPILQPARIRRRLTEETCFGMSTVMGRSAAFRTHLFDPEIRLSEDYELWTRMAAARLSFANIREPLVRYRIHATQASQHGSRALDMTSRRVRARYCASLLGDPALIQQLRTDCATMVSLDRSATLIESFLPENPEFDVHCFRYLLAWQYQLLPRHGVREWRHWLAIQKRLGLKLDSNYLLNIALLASLPIPRKSSAFDTLIKLKR
jgi:glycosyltransferase involved in cell wall biosynthesis